jgi:ATP-binding cassette subfamily B protein
VSTFGFVFQYLRRYSTAMAVTIASMVLLVGAELAAPMLVRRMIAAVQGGSAGQTMVHLLAGLALLAAGVYGARGLLQFLRSYMAHVAGWGVVGDVREHIYRHLQRLSLSFYAERQTGQLMSRVVNDSDMFERLIAHALPDIAVNILMFAGVSAILAALNFRLLLLSMIPIPLIVLAMRGFARYVRPAFRDRQKELGELNATLNDNLSGIREIKAFVQEDTEAARIGDHITRFLLSNLKALRMMAVFHPAVEFAASLGTAGWWPARRCRWRTWWPSFSTWRCSTSRCASWPGRGSRYRRRWPARSGWPS